MYGSGINSSELCSFKLVLGCPGPDFIVKEPDKYLVQHTYKQSANPVAQKIAAPLMDMFSYIVEQLIQPPHDQFPKIMLTMQINAWLDWLNGYYIFYFLYLCEDTTVTNLFTKYQRYDIIAEGLFENIPTLELSHRRARLYNLCSDPSEQFDLATKMPTELQRMYEALIQELRAVKYNPIQQACDASDFTAQANSACAPFLGDTEEVPLDRLNLAFKEQFDTFMRVQFVVVGLTLVSMFSCCGLCFVCCCWRKKGVRKLKEQ